AKPQAAAQRKTYLLGAFHFAGLLASGPVVLALELLDTAGRIDELHLAGKKRMADRANFDGDVLLGTARGELVAATAGHRRGFILGMDLFFHGSLPFNVWEVVL